MLASAIDDLTTAMLAFSYHSGDFLILVVKNLAQQEDSSLQWRELFEQTQKGNREGFRNLHPLYEICRNHRFWQPGLHRYLTLNSCFAQVIKTPVGRDRTQ